MSYILSDPIDDLRMSDSSESSTSQPEVRKRKRADYSKLSPDERNQKRKLKNRMSAQQARDRKKQYVTELEDQVKRLEKENAALRRLCSNRGNTDSAVDPLVAAVNSAGLSVFSEHPKVVKSLVQVTQGTQTACATGCKTYVAIIKNPNNTAAGPTTSNIKKEIKPSSCSKKMSAVDKSAIIKLPKSLRFAKNTLHENTNNNLKFNKVIPQMTQNTIAQQMTQNNIAQQMTQNTIAQQITQNTIAQHLHQNSIVQPHSRTNAQLIATHPTFNQPQYMHFNLMEPIMDQVTTSNQNFLDQPPLENSFNLSLDQEESNVKWDEFLQPIMKKDDTLTDDSNYLLNIGSPDSGLGVDSLINTVGDFSDFSDLNEDNLGEVDLFSDLYLS